MFSKKAIMGVGVLLIFISTILVAAIAAGVLIRTSGAIGQKAIEVEKVSRERLTTGYEFVKINGDANESAGTLANFELLVRLKAASNPIDFNETIITITTDTISERITLGNSSSWNANCMYVNLAEEEDFCFEPMFGNNNSILETEELTFLRFRTNSTNAVQANDEIEIQLVPKVGELTVINLRIPSIKQTKVVLY